MVNYSRMTHSMYCDKKQKRIGECEDLNHAPSAKRLKTKNGTDSETTCSSHQNAIPYSDNPVFSAPHKRNLFQSPAQQSFLEFQNESYVAQNNAACLPREECFALQSDLKYLPDLNAVENPHYYENNKLLFELYVERIQRATISHSSSSSQHQTF